MPWKETCVESEKLRFITEMLKGELPMSILCESFGISRQAGYELRRRFEKEGLDGLRARSRAPHRPASIGKETAEKILELRRRKPYWGPKKLRAYLQSGEPTTIWPAASTIGDLLRRSGLSEPRRRRRTAAPQNQPFLAVEAPNDLWCIDFKGHFRTRDGSRIDPLTITDADSRFLIDCQIVPPDTGGVWPVLERAFHEFGLPRTIRSDNGSPFASTGAGGLTRLAVHWIKLGIRLERIDPGSPQQNGRHERMHGTLKGETSQPPAEGPAEQQERFDRFRHDFNHSRPHEALEQTTPASRYHPSPRPYPAKIEPPWYDAEHAVRQVRSSGEIKWGGELVFISEALPGQSVGIAETEAGDWLVRYADIDLGLIDRRTKKLRRFLAPRPGRKEAERNRKTVTHVSGP
jgi:putative transposase